MITARFTTAQDANKFRVDLESDNHRKRADAFSIEGAWVLQHRINNKRKTFENYQMLLQHLQKQGW